MKRYPSTVAAIVMLGLAGLCSALQAQEMPTDADDSILISDLEGTTPEQWLSDIAEQDFAAMPDTQREAIVSELFLLLRGGEEERQLLVLNLLHDALYAGARASLLEEIDRRMKEAKSAVTPVPQRARHARLLTRLCLYLDELGDAEMARKLLSDLWAHEAKTSGTVFALEALVEVGDETHVSLFSEAAQSANKNVAREGLRGLFRVNPERCFEGPVYGQDMQSFVLRAPTSTWVQTWTDVDSLDLDVHWPEDAPASAQIMVHLQDWDYLWYQNLLPGSIRPGETKRFRAHFASAGSRWEPRGHHASWHFRALAEPKEVGIDFICKAPYTGTGRLERITVVNVTDEAAPYIRNVRSNRDRVPCYEKFELTFNAPDRYVNPFDADEVSVTAEIEMPNGKPVVIDGFYARPFFRKVEPSGERISPQGPPYWSVRFAPSVPGRHSFLLRIRDRHGEATWGPSSFEATEAQDHGYVRVSTQDYRYLEFTDGTAYFPIGHNIRSPFDSRTDTRFPWKQRWPEGSAIYERFFRKMSTHGENMAEVWCAAWSLGIEWSEIHPWYHGLGQYNMMHAWEMDQVLDAAEAHGIYLNYVVLNHGRYSDYVDEEWAENPHNIAAGGYLASPQDFFTDTRAHEDFRRMMRYILARWGYSTKIFAWELWNELDLTGAKSIAQHANQNRPEVLDWHRMMSRYVKETDPYDHLISTHVSGDYTKQNKAIIALPDIDLSAVDAYHNNADPLHIVTLLRQTAAYNNPLGKPVFVTEFGGSHMAGSLKHLDDSLHAALWSSTAIPIAGTPLFWWWLTIDEEHFYPKFLAMQQFMDGEDRRDPDMQPVTAHVMQGNAASPSHAVLCLQNKHRALGWIWNTLRFRHADLNPEKAATDCSINLTGLEPADYVVEFWDTQYGRVVAKENVTSTDGRVTAPIPPFLSDLAFKLKPR